MKKTWFLLITYALLLILLLQDLSVQCLSFSLSKLSYLNIARGFVGTKEKGSNRGYWVDRWNKNVGAPSGSPYCAAFQYFCLDSAGIKVPWKKSGLARSFVLSKRTVKDGIDARTFTALDVINGKEKVLEGDFGVYQKGTTANGHAIVANKNWNGISGETIEANTSSGMKGSQDNGDGVWKRTRKIEPFNYFRLKWFTRLKKL